MATIYYLNQYFTTTLSKAGGIDASETTGIVLQSVSGLDTTKPGIACVSWADPIVTSTAEWITFTSVNSTTKELNGVTRGAEGYAAKTHDNGAVIAFPISESHINNLAAKLGGIDTIDNDIDLGDGYNIQEAGIDPYKTIYIDAGAWSPTTTSGCATVATVEAGTNDIDYKVLDFATDADENAFVNFQMPGNWDAGVIQFRYVWTNASGLTTETVTFTLSGRSYANDDAIDQAVGTAVAVADTWIAQGDIHISAWSGDVTLTGATAGEWVHLELMRDVSEDDLTGDCRLIGVQIRYKESQYNQW